MDESLRHLDRFDLRVWELCIQPYMVVCFRRWRLSMQFCVNLNICVRGQQVGKRFGIVLNICIRRHTACTWWEGLYVLFHLNKVFQDSLVWDIKVVQNIKVV